jgi:hypothetical protein
VAASLNNKQLKMALAPRAVPDRGADAAWVAALEERAVDLVAKDAPNAVLLFQQHVHVKKKSR